MMKSYQAKLLIYLAAIFVLSSCDTGEYKPSAQADARIIVKVVPGDTLFGLGLYAYTDSEFKSVSAYYSGNSESFYTLEPYNNAANDYYYETPIEEMGEEPPVAGAYYFDIEITTGEYDKFSDILYTDYSLPPNITRCEYISNQIVVQWDEITDYGVIKFYIFNQQNELLYASSSIDKDDYIYTLSYNNLTWEIDEAPASGEQLIVKVVFYTFELGNSAALNTQSASSIEKSITWGG